MSIVAEVNVARGTGRLAYVLPVTRARVTPVDPDSAVTIRTRDGRGQMLDKWEVPVKPFAEEAPGDAGHALCDAIMALHPDAAAIELYVKGQLVDTLQSATTFPSVRDVRVRAFDARGLVLGWDGDAGQDPRHSYNVQLSDDNGRSWRTVAVGVRDRQITIHPDNVPHDRRVLFRVQATDGFRSTEAVVDWSAPGSR